MEHAYAPKSLMWETTVRSILFIIVVFSFVELEQSINTVSLQWKKVPPDVPPRGRAGNRWNRWNFEVLVTCVQIVISFSFGVI